MPKSESLEKQRRSLRGDFPDLAEFVDHLRMAFGTEAGGTLKVDGQLVRAWGVMKSEREAI